MIHSARIRALACTFALLFALIGCDGLSGPKDSARGLDVNVIPDPNAPPGGFPGGVPDAVKTLRVVFESEDGQLRCCVAVDPLSAPPVNDPNSIQHFVELVQPPAGEATLRIDGFATDFVPTINGITDTCEVSPASAVKGPCHQTRPSTPSFRGGPTHVSIPAHGRGDAGDIPFLAAPFLLELQPMPGDDVMSPVAFTFIVGDAVTGVDVDSIQLDISDGGAPVPINLNLTPCDDKSAQTCSADGDLMVTGFQAESVPVPLAGPVQVRIRALNLAPTPQVLDFIYNFGAITPTPSHTPLDTATPTSTSTSTPSRTPSQTPMSSPTPSASATQTATNTAVDTPTQRSTATLTFTVTPTRTATPLSTTTPTVTSTSTATPTPTPTGTARDTATPTSTLSDTPSRTATSTPTVTRTRTVTPTVTSTPTATLSRTPVATFTATPTRLCESGIEIQDPRYIISNNLLPGGDDRLRVSGHFQVNNRPPINPIVNGLTIKVYSRFQGTELTTIVIPPGLKPSRRGAGWRANSTQTRWTYEDFFGTKTPGIRRVAVTHRASTANGLYAVQLYGSDGTFYIDPNELPLRLDIVLGGPTQAAARQCGTAFFNIASSRVPHCVVNQMGNLISCR